MFLPLGDDIDKRSFPVIPTLLIVSNVIVFFLVARHLMETGAAKNPVMIREFFRTWGLVPSELADGKLIGLLTHMTLHAGLGHLLGNMIFLWAFACSLEVCLGRWALLGLYVLCGVVGGICQATFDWTSTAPIVGASGAIAGLMGSYAILFGPLSKIKGLLFLGFTPVRISIPAWLFASGWIASQMYFANQDVQGNMGVAWHAHLGGFMAGILVGSLLRYDTNKTLVKDRHGILRFEPTGGKSGTDQYDLEFAETATFPVPANCPYCQESLDETHRLAPNLARCGAATCQRMICLETIDQVLATS